MELRTDSFHLIQQKNIISKYIKKVLGINKVDTLSIVPSLTLDLQGKNVCEYKDLIDANSLNYYFNGGEFEPENIYAHWCKGIYYSISVKSESNIFLFTDINRIKTEICRYKNQRWDHKKLSEALNLMETIYNTNGIVVTNHDTQYFIYVIDVSNNNTYDLLYEMEGKLGWMPINYNNKFEKEIFNTISNTTKHLRLFKKFWVDNISIWFKHDLKIFDLETFFKPWETSLTQFGREYYKQIINYFIDTNFRDKETSLIDKVLSDCYLNKTIKTTPQEYFSKVLRKEIRNSENHFRNSIGIKKIGEGNVTETKLYYEIKMRLTQYEVIHQGNPKWLGRQRLDIYIPELNVAVEYQGGQHFDEKHYFNSHTPDAFQKNKERDERKKLKCDENGCKLIYVYEGERYDIDQIIFNIIN